MYFVCVDTCLTAFIASMAVRPQLVTFNMSPATRYTSSFISLRLYVNPGEARRHGRLDCRRHTIQWSFEDHAPKTGDVVVYATEDALLQPSATLGREEHHESTPQRNHRIGEEVGSFCQGWRSVLGLDYPTYPG